MVVSICKCVNLKGCLSVHSLPNNEYLNPLSDDKILDWSKFKQMQTTF